MEGGVVDFTASSNEDRSRKNSMTDERNKIVRPPRVAADNFEQDQAEQENNDSFYATDFLS